MAEQNVNEENREGQMVVFQTTVDAIMHYRIRITELLGGNEEYQQMLNYYVDIAAEIIRVGQLPASDEGREMVDILFYYLIEMLLNLIDLMD